MCQVYCNRRLFQENIFKSVVPVLSLLCPVPASAPETVPFPWQFSTRTLFTLAPRATPVSRPLTTPAM